MDTILVKVFVIESGKKIGGVRQNSSKHFRILFQNLPSHFQYLASSIGLRILLDHPLIIVLCGELPVDNIV